MSKRDCARLHAVYFQNNALCRKRQELHVVELIVSIFVVSIAVLIYRRSGNVFSLPFFWVAYFLFQYLGLLQLRSISGGISYEYAALAFGVFYLGLLAADFLILYRSRTAKSKEEDRQIHQKSDERTSKLNRKPKGTRIKLLFPSLPLQVGLFVSLIGATFVSFIFFAQNGIPVFSSFPAMAWVKSTSGIINRIMTVFGPGCYASLGLVAWAINRETGSRAAKGLMYLGLGLAILSDALLATKAAAIMVFIWFNIMLFYLNKKREFRKSLLPLIIVVVPVSFAIVAVRLMSSQGYWQSGGIYQTFYNRVTTVSAEPVDFVFKYLDRFGPVHTEGIRSQVKRIEEQLTGQRRTPILSEYVYDLMNDQRTTVTGLSAALTIYGTGYVAWGMAGMLLYSFLQGLGIGWIHRYLLRAKTMNFISLLLWGAVIGYVLAVSVSGSYLVGLESIAFVTIPPLALLLPFCGFFTLPMARRYRTSVGRKVSSIPQA